MQAPVRVRARTHARTQTTINLKSHFLLTVMRRKVVVAAAAAAAAPAAAARRRGSSLGKDLMIGEKRMVCVCRLNEAF